ncbi:capsular polysaccharide synthesis protein [Sphingobacterium populi]|uniref:capsular polysaccharide synthesis protein n=1 Tax=Sphingobacterium sp. CFCC 11742 TaxID=1775560 RepID=UPI0008359BF6|nr:capsular polysaccharide synthesis protein [Sphingobacterium sp. CFCC 11742]
MSKIKVKTLWISSIFEDMQKLCMQSFLNVGCEVEIYTYSPIKNIPNGVKLMNANEIIPKQYIFRDFHNSYATFSDWFRIKLLFLKGGWWVDSDMLCIKPFEIESEYVFATEKVMGNFEEIVTISNCVIKMEKRSVLGERLLLDIEKKSFSYSR